MSLHGLDSAEISEAYQQALAQEDGWFLLHYLTRDTVQLLASGTGGLAHARSHALAACKDDPEPIFGWLNYRDNKVLLKCLPSGISRLIQARATVHFTEIIEQFSHDVVVNLAYPADITDASIAPACSIELDPSLLEQSPINEPERQHSPKDADLSSASAKGPAFESPEIRPSTSIHSSKASDSPRITTPSFDGSIGQPHSIEPITQISHLDLSSPGPLESGKAKPWVVPLSTSDSRRPSTTGNRQVATLPSSILSQQAGSRQDYLLHASRSALSTAAGSSPRPRSRGQDSIRSVHSSISSRSVNPIREKHVASPSISNSFTSSREPSSLKTSTLLPPSSSGVNPAIQADLYGYTSQLSNSMHASIPSGGTTPHLQPRHAGKAPDGARTPEKDKLMMALQQYQLQQTQQSESPSPGSDLQLDNRIEPLPSPKHDPVDNNFEAAGPDRSFSESPILKSTEPYTLNIKKSTATLRSQKIADPVDEVENVPRLPETFTTAVTKDPAEGAEPDASLQPLKNLTISGPDTGTPVPSDTTRSPEDASPSTKEGTVAENVVDSKLLPTVALDPKKEKDVEDDHNDAKAEVASDQTTQEEPVPPPDVEPVQATSPSQPLNQIEAETEPAPDSTTTADNATTKISDQVKTEPAPSAARQAEKPTGSVADPVSVIRSVSTPLDKTLDKNPINEIARQFRSASSNTSRPESSHSQQGGSASLFAKRSNVSSGISSRIQKLAENSSATGGFEPPSYSRAASAAGMRTGRFGQNLDLLKSQISAVTTRQKSIIDSMTPSGMALNDGRSRSSLSMYSYSGGPAQISRSPSPLLTNRNSISLNRTGSTASTSMPPPPFIPHFPSRSSTPQGTAPNQHRYPTSMANGQQDSVSVTATIVRDSTSEWRPESIPGTAVGRFELMESPLTVERRSSVVDPFNGERLPMTDFTNQKAGYKRSSDVWTNKGYASQSGAAVPGTPSHSNSRASSVVGDYSRRQSLAASVQARSELVSNIAAPIGSITSTTQQDTTLNRNVASPTGSVLSSGNGSASSSRASRTEKLRQRVSITMESVGLKSLGGLISPTKREKSPPGREAVGAIQTLQGIGSRSNSSRPPSIVNIMSDNVLGDVNVQFPDSLLWKRRFITISSTGEIILSYSCPTQPMPSQGPVYGRPSSAASIAGLSGTMRRYHISAFKMPYIPDRDCEELPNSVILDFHDGRSLQCACENSEMQKKILTSLVNAWRSWGDGAGMREDGRARNEGRW